MYVLLIRHGQSTNNLLYESTGGWEGRVPDPGLTALGRVQSEQLAESFASGSLVRPDVLVTSLMLRAVQTAAPVAEALDLPIEGHLELNEVRGVFAGTTRDPVAHAGAPASVLRQMSSRLVLPQEASEHGWYDRGLETPAGAVMRARAVVDEIRTRFGGTSTTVALICHEWIAQYLLRVAIGLETQEDEEIPWFALNNTGSTLIDFPEEEDYPACVRWSNRLDHLGADQITA